MTASLPPREPVLRALIDACGPDFARSARTTDAVAGRRASFVAVPATVGAVSVTPMNKLQPRVAHVRSCSVRTIPVLR